MYSIIYITFLSVFVLFVAITLVKSYAHVSPVGDEISWYFHTDFYDHAFVQHRVLDAYWQSYEAYDHPQLSKFIYGAYLSVMEKESRETRKTLGAMYDRWQFYFDRRLTDIRTSDFFGHILLMRQVNILFGILSAVCILYIVYTVSGNVILSFLIPILLLYNPLYMSVMLRATNDAHSVLFMLASLSLVCAYIRHPSFFIAMLSGIFSGLAASSKLTGFVCVSGILYYFLFRIIDSGKRMHTTAYHAIGFVISVLVLWILTNPTVYPNPIAHSIRFFDFRIEQSIRLRHAFPLVARNTVGERMRALSCAIFMTCSNNQVNGNLTHSVFVNLLLFVLGCMFLLRKSNGMFHHQSLLLGIVTLSHMLVIGMFLPTDSEQYYVFVLILISVISGCGLAYCVELLRFFRLKSG